MRFLVFALILALMVSMITADKSRERNSKHGKRGHHRRYRRYVPIENAVDTNTNLLQQEVPFQYYYPLGY